MHAHREDANGEDAHEELDIKSLALMLAAFPVGHTIDYVPRLESTMPPAHERAQQSSTRGGHLVVTEEQVAGKGRRGRAWLAPYATSLLVSVVLKPPLLPASPAQIPMAAGLAVADALLDAAPELAGGVALKWPNDVLLETRAVTGKAAGILVESALEDHALTYAVLGIGINVNQTASELPSVAERMTAPVSIRAALGRPVDRTELLRLLCLRLTSWLDPERSTDDVLAAWRSRLATLGQRVNVYVLPQSDRATMSGRAMDVTAAGDLLVEDEAGVLHTFSAADVTVRSGN